MLKKPACYAIVFPLVVMISGCLVESTLDAKGGGVMTLTYPVAKQEDFAGLQKQLQSAAVKLTSSQFIDQGEKSQGVFKLQFDDVTKLSTTQFFSDLTVTRADGEKKGTKVVTGKVKHTNPNKLPDKVVEVFGKETKIVVTLPGTVVDSNGKASGGNTVTWTWGVREFYEMPEVVMTVTYQEAAAH